MPNPRPFIRALPHVSNLAERFGERSSRRWSAGAPTSLQPILDRLPPTAPNFARLYRVDPNVPLSAVEDMSVFGRETFPELDEVKGQWFTSDIKNLPFYMASRGDPKLSYLDVPRSMLDEFRADLNPAVRDFSMSGGEYIIPRAFLGAVKPVPLRPQPMPGIPALRREFLNE